MATDEATESETTKAERPMSYNVRHEVAKEERLKAARAAREEAERKWEELTQARDAVGRAWLAADLLQREIEREP